MLKTRVISKWQECSTSLIVKEGYKGAFVPWNLDILNFIHRDVLNVMMVNHKASLISRDGAKTGYMHMC